MLKKPDLIEFRAFGDFVTDASRWLLKAEGNGTLGLRKAWSSFYLRF
jgi:hypothetical protein